MQVIDYITHYATNNYIILINKEFNKKIINQVHKRSYKIKYNNYMHRIDRSNIKLNYKLEYNWKHELNRVKKFKTWDLFDNIYCIQMSSCQVDEIPKEIGNCIRVRDLQLHMNNLKKIPKEIGNLVKLDSLTLSYNKLKYIPKQIGNLVNLTGLYIRPKTSLQNGRIHL